MASNNFINECKEPANSNRLATITDNDELVLNQDNYIQDFTIDDGCYVDGSIIGTTYAKKLNINLIGSNTIDLQEKDLNVQVGVKYENDSEEYIDLGKYKVEKPKDETTNNYSQITAYDDLINKLDMPYQCNLDFTTTKTYLDLFNDLCYNLNLTPKTLSFDNDDIELVGNPFTNNETNRIVLQSIEKVSCTFAQVDVEDNELELCWLSTSVNPDYTFELDDYTSLNGGKIVYGPINSLVIKNSQIDDENVSISDDESIEEYGEHQLVISEDYLLYTPELRQQAITAIWNKVHNLTYVDCELETYYGKPFLKIGDKIRVKYETTELVNNEETIVEHQFDTYVLTHTFKYDGSFYSKITSPVLTEQQVATKQDKSLGEILRNTVITVDKINGEVTTLVTKTEQLEDSIELLNPKLDNNSIFISTNSSRIPFSNKTYTINFTTEFIGESVSVVPTTSNSYTGITVNRTNNSISFTVTNATALQNEVNKYTFTWSVTSNGTTYTQTRIITVNALISETEQNVIISSTAPSDTSVLWFNTNDNMIYIYENNAWVVTNDYNDQLDDINSQLNDLNSLNDDVQNLQDSIDDINSELENKVNSSTFDTLQSQVTNLQTDTYSKTEIQQIANGTGVDGVMVSAVISTSGTFDKDGMHYQKSTEDTITTINYAGLEVADKNNNELLFAGVRSGSSESIVETQNLKVSTYLTMCNNTGRMEEFQDVSGVVSGTHSGPALFIIGGN